MALASKLQSDERPAGPRKLGRSFTIRTEMNRISFRQGMLLGFLLVVLLLGGGHPELAGGRARG